MASKNSVIKTFTPEDIDSLSATGVYTIQNKINKKFYIGKAERQGTFLSDSGFYIRWSNHINCLKADRHDNRYLQNSWNKYGGENFEFSILHKCPPEKCLEMEDFYLYLLEPQYNLMFEKGSPKNQKCTEETKKKLSKARSKHFSLVNPEGEVINGFNLTAFCKENNLAQGNLTKVISGRVFQAKGYRQNIPENVGVNIKDVSNPQAKEYSFKSENGIVAEGINVAKFCKENSLNIGAMWDVYKGKRKSYKGWTKND
jgi:group I intron endonuclease